MKKASQRLMKGFLALLLFASTFLTSAALVEAAQGNSHEITHKIQVNQKGTDGLREFSGDIKFNIPEGKMSKGNDIIILRDVSTSFKEHFADQDRVIEQIVSELDLTQDRIMIINSLPPTYGGVTVSLTNDMDTINKGIEDKDTWTRLPVADGSYGLARLEYDKNKGDTTNSAIFISVANRELYEGYSISDVSASAKKIIDAGYKSGAVFIGPENANGIVKNALKTVSDPSYLYHYQDMKLGMQALRELTNSMSEIQDANLEWTLSDEFDLLTVNAKDQDGNEIPTTISGNKTEISIKQDKNKTITFTYTFKEKKRLTETTSIGTGIIESSEGKENIPVATVSGNNLPVISANNVTMKAGNNFDPKQNVTATDAEDGDLTSKIIVTQNTVNTQKPGVYKVTYQITDSDDNTVTKTIDVTIEAKDINSPKLGGPVYDIATEADGTAQGASAVIAYVDEKEIGKSEVASDGDFTITFPMQVAETVITFVAKDEYGGTSTPINVTVLEATLKINEKVTTGFVRDTQQLTATTTPVNQAVTWMATNERVATVDAKTGLVTYKAVGNVAIRATLKSGKSTQIMITVTKKEIDAPVLLTPIYDNTTEALGTAQPSSNITAKDSEGNILGETTADSEGKFTIEFPEQPAETSIAFTSVDDKGNESEKTEIEVQASAIKINEQLTSAFAGTMATLTATTTPAGQKATWVSSSSTIATVSSSGVVTFKAEGNVAITAKLANGKSDTITINVKGSPQVMTPIYDSTSEITGTSTALGTINAYVDGEPVGATTVKSDGTFQIKFPMQTAGKVISFKVKDTNGNESLPTSVTVKATTVKINENVTAGYVQDTQQLTATTTPANQEVEWSTSDSTVAEVSKTGLVTYLAAGEVAIKATLKNNQVATIKIAVTNEILAVQPPVITTTPIYDVTTTIKGTAKAEGESKATKVTAYTFGLQIGTAEVKADGTFTMDVPVQVAGYTIKFVAEDRRGNVSSPTSSMVVPSTIRINEKPTTGFEGEKQQLTATATPTNQAIVWTTSNENVATVSTTGLVKYVGTGEVIVKATLKNGSFAQVTIIVAKKEIESPTVNTKIYDLTTTASGTAPALGKVIVQDTSGNQIGETTVNSDGSFTVTFPEQKAKEQMKFLTKNLNGITSLPTVVEVEKAQISINEKIKTGSVGDTATLTATTTPTGQKVTWSSSDQTKATINATTGVITYKAPGSVALTASLSTGTKATITITVISSNGLTLDASEVGGKTVTGVTAEANTQVRLSINGVTKSVQTSDATTGKFTFNIAALKAGDVVKVEMKINGIYAISKTFTVKEQEGGGTNPGEALTINKVVDTDTKVTGTTGTPNSQVRFSLNGNLKTVVKSDASGNYSYTIGKLKVGDIIKAELRVNGVYTISKEAKVEQLQNELTLNPVAASDKKVTGSTKNPNTTIRISINGSAKAVITTDAIGKFIYNNSKLVTGDKIKVEMKIEGIFSASKEVTVTEAEVDTITLHDVTASQTVITGKTNQANAQIRVSLNGKAKNIIKSDQTGNFTYSIGKLTSGDEIKVELRVGNVYAVTTTTTCS
ncbi:Ig-like domain-containing protein [Listeria booriae]|uniref:Ig-like domain-containing protein n=1 Tax=Listeria booriae TaxID=1552123 RepID=UPI00162901BC|nr:Ig-like domain-containing protein [Listeria booriae]MBC2321736.1 DUF5011 domain-containing protein [Listeria booriae]MCD2205773.1 Ig-like domain-containing protein [Listeria booriae]